MTSFRFIGLCVCLLFLCSVGLGTAPGAIVAPLNGTEAIDAHGTQYLKVHNPDHEKQALQIEEMEHFVIVQGHPDTRRTVNVAATNRPQHPVATVEVPEVGELLYHVRGVIIRDGRGEGAGRRPSWAAEYNRGEARIVLEINEDGPHDDIVALGNNGATLRIWILGATGIVPVRLTANPAGRLSIIPPPDAEPFHVNVIAGPRPTSGSLNGLGAGEVTIMASATVDNEEVFALITAYVAPFRGVVLPRDRWTGRSYHRVGVGERGTLSVEGTNLDTIKPLTWSIGDGTAIMIDDVTVHGTASFTAGETAGQVRLTLTDKNGFATHHMVDVVEPARETAGLSEITSYPDGQRAARMLVFVYWHPMDVSFGNVLSREISGWSSQNSGFFLAPMEHEANTQPARRTVPGNHSVDAVSLNLDKQVIDEDGTIVWNVPVEWQVNRGDNNWDDQAPVRTLPHREMTFKATEAGQAVTVEKFKRWVKRLSDGRTSHNFYGEP